MARFLFLDKCWLGIKQALAIKRFPTWLDHRKHNLWSLFKDIWFLLKGQGVIWTEPCQQPEKLLWRSGTQRRWHAGCARPSRRKTTLCKVLNSSATTWFVCSTLRMSHWTSSTYCWDPFEIGKIIITIIELYLWRLSYVPWLMKPWRYVQLEGI